MCKKFQEFSKNNIISDCVSIPNNDNCSHITYIGTIDSKYTVIRAHNCQICSSCSKFNRGVWIGVSGNKVTYICETEVIPRDRVSKKGKDMTISIYDKLPYKDALLKREQVKEHNNLARVENEKIDISCKRLVFTPKCMLYSDQGIIISRLGPVTGSYGNITNGYATKLLKKCDTDIYASLLPARHFECNGRKYKVYYEASEKPIEEDLLDKIRRDTKYISKAYYYETMFDYYSKRKQIQLYESDNIKLGLDNGYIKREGDLITTYNSRQFQPPYVLVPAHECNFCSPEQKKSKTYSLWDVLDPNFPENNFPCKNPKLQKMANELIAYLSLCIEHHGDDPYEYWGYTGSSSGICQRMNWIPAKGLSLKESCRAIYCYKLLLYKLDQWCKTYNPHKGDFNTKPIMHKAPAGCIDTFLYMEMNYNYRSDWQKIKEQYFYKNLQCSENMEYDIFYQMYPKHLVKYHEILLEMPSNLIVSIYIDGISKLKHNAQINLQGSSIDKYFLAKIGYGIDYMQQQEKINRQKEINRLTKLKLEAVKREDYTTAQRYHSELTVMANS